MEGRRQALTSAAGVGAIATTSGTASRKHQPEGKIHRPLWVLQRMGWDTALEAQTTTRKLSSFGPIARRWGSPEKDENVGKSRRRQRKRAAEPETPPSPLPSAPPPGLCWCRGDDATRQRGCGDGLHTGAVGRGSPRSFPVSEALTTDVLRTPLMDRLMDRPAPQPHNPGTSRRPERSVRLPLKPISAAKAHGGEPLTGELGSGNPQISNWSGCGTRHRDGTPRQLQEPSRLLSQNAWAESLARPGEPWLLDPSTLRLPDSAPSGCLHD